MSAVFLSLLCNGGTDSFYPNLIDSLSKKTAPASQGLFF